MAHPQNGRRPVGFIDTDSTDEAIAPENYRYAINFENGFAYAGQQNSGQNVKGMIPVLYTFTAGVRYKTIGFCEDRQYGTGLYFVWASDNNHLILRWYKNKTSPATPNGVIQLVMEYNFGWNENVYIHSSRLINGKLLYWTDNVMPRKINIEKANNTEKLKSWDVVTYRSYVGLVSIPESVSVLDLAGNLIAFYPFTYPVDKTLSESYAYIASVINNPTSSVYPYISAEACLDHIHITEKVVNTYNVVFSNPFDVIPSNFYGFNPEDRFWDLSKWAPNEEPIPTYLQDPQAAVNKVQQIPFQFVYQLFYDDSEPSTLSPISQIAIENIDAGLYNKDLYNYIQLLLNNSYLLDPNSWVLAKRIKIMVREHNDGIWSEVANDLLYNYYDKVNNVNQLVYNFYNTESKIAISAELATTQYDLVPIKANTLEFAKDRIMFGGFEAGRDAVECPDMSMDVTFNPDPQQPLRKITGKLKIFTYSMNFEPGRYGNTIYNPTLAQQEFLNQGGAQSIGFLYRQPAIAELNGLICHDSTMITPSPTPTDPNPVPYSQSPFTWYGGIGYAPSGRANAILGVQNKVSNEYDQRLPEGGWPIYAAGTPYWCLSKQDNFALETTQDRSLEISTQQNIDAIANYFPSYAGASLLNNAGSSFEMKVPPGVYTIRVASNWCSFGDKLSKGQAYDLFGQMWRKTSSPIWGAFDSGGTWNGGYQEIIVDTTNGDVDLGSFVILDMSPCPGFEFEGEHRATLPWTNWIGYLYDNFGRIDIRSETWEGVPVEKAGVMLSKGAGVGYNTLGQTVYGSAAKVGQSFTDHNGFWFIAGDATTGSLPSLINGDASGGIGSVLGDIQFSAYQVGNTTIKGLNSPNFIGNINDLIQKTFNVLSNENETPNRLYNILLATDNIVARASCMTFVEGKVTDQDNQLVGGINIVVSEGDVGYTDTYGEFSLRVWGNNKVDIINLPASDPASFKPAPLGFQVQGATELSGVFPNPFPSAPFGIHQGRTFLLPMSNISEYNIQNIPYILTPVNLTQFAINNTVQTNTPPYSPTSIWDNGTTVVVRGEYYITKSHPRGSFYKYALRYKDQQSRQCAVITQKEIQVYLPFDTEDLSRYFPITYPTPTYRQGIPILQLNINHQPPIWADTYEVMRSKEIKMASYLDWIINDVEYVQRIAGNNTTSDYITSYDNKDATHIRLNIANLAYYQAMFSQSQVGYTWNSGDRIRFKWNSNLEYFQGLLDYQIVAFESPGYLYIPFNQELPQLYAGTGIRTYTPKDTTEIDIYYATGQIFECTTPNQIGNAHTVTAIPINDGDCYWRNRIIPVYDVLRGYVQDYPAIIQSASISDFYQSADQDIGRTGIVDPYFKQQFYPTKIRPSNTYIFNTQTNGLSTYLPLNDVNDIDPSYGEILKLEQIGLALQVMCRNKVASYYLGAVTTSDKNGNGILSISEQLFGNERPEQVSYGCQNPESVAKYEDKGYIYGWDAIRGIAWRKASNGLIEISDYLFRGFFNEYRNIPVWSSPGIFDVMKKKYILTIYPKLQATCFYIANAENSIFIDNTVLPTNIGVGDVLIIQGQLINSNEQIIATGTIVSISPDGVTKVYMGSNYPLNGQPVQVFYKGAGVTVAFNEGKNGWDTFYSFTPDCYGSLNNQLASFSNGNLWLHDLDNANTNRNNFYGVKYVSRLKMIFNVDPENVKNWWAILLDQLRPNGGNDWFLPTVTTPYSDRNQREQLSNIPNTKFERYFQFWHAFFMRDVNTPNTTFPLLTGDSLQGNTITVELENPSIDKFDLKEVRVNYSTTGTTTK